MIPLAFLPWRLILPALAVLALLGGAWFHGRSSGADAVQANWDAERVAQAAAAEAARESNRLRGQAAATTYETQRAAFARRATPRTPEARYALTATICPPAGAFGKPLELGDVPIPGTELQRLRDAGADFTGH